VLRRDRPEAGGRRDGARALIASGFVAAVFCLAMTVPSRSEESLAGTYVVVDGPQAGVDVVAEASGRVQPESSTSLDFSARGFVRRPSSSCDALHFTGRIEGDKSGKACWRVIPFDRTSTLLRAMRLALFSEERARGVNERRALESLRSARHELEESFDLVEKAAQADEISEGKFGNLRDDFVEIRQIDDAAMDLLRQDKRQEARRKLEKAQHLKHQIVDRLPLVMLEVREPVLEPIDAAFDSAKRQTVYTERATDPDGRHLTYHWTLVEHNDPTCINFEPNRPKENQAIWHHGEDQGCHHALEGSRGHVGTVGVVVRDGKFQCAAFYEGSQGDSGSPTGTGSEPVPCQPIEG
jgi:hypothetical protein